MVSATECNRKNLSSFPGRAECTQAKYFCCCELLLKTNDVGDRRPNFPVLAVWNVSYTLIKILEGEGSISSFSFCGQLANCYSHVLSLIYPMDELALQKLSEDFQENILGGVILVYNQ